MKVLLNRFCSPTSLGMDLLNKRKFHIHLLNKNQEQPGSGKNQEPRTAWLWLFFAGIYCCLSQTKNKYIISTKNETTITSC